MRKFIDIARTLTEGDVVAFPGNPRPVDSMAAVLGAKVYGFPEKVDLDDFAKAYVIAALWSTSDESDDTGGERLDQHYGIQDIATPTLKQMAADCTDFQQANAELLNAAYRIRTYDEERAGHDFWLTRNHHGAGFWDRGLIGDLGKKLSDAAHAYPEFDLYVGDDKMIHGS